MGQEGEGRGQGAASFAGIPILGVHMLVGITVLVLLFIRLLVRWRFKRPEWVTTASAFLDEVIAARRDCPRKRSWRPARSSS